MVNGLVPSNAPSSIVLLNLFPYPCIGMPDDGSVTTSLLSPSSANICILSEPAEANIRRGEDEIVLVGK